MATQQEEYSLEGLETLQKIVPFPPLATSYGRGWKGLQAVRYRESSANGEFSTSSVPLHVIALGIQPAEKLDLQFGGIKRDSPSPAGRIAVVPAGSSVLWRRQGSMDTLFVFLEPNLIARVAAESFEFDPTRRAVSPLIGLNAPEFRSVMFAVDAELRAGAAGWPLLIESLATTLSVHLIRHITGERKLNPSDGILSRRKLQTVIEFIMENLGGSPTVEQMAAVVHLSPYHFARQFKAATGSAPYQYVIVRRVARAQHLLRTNAGIGLGEVAFRSGFSDQSNLSFHFKRIVGVTPGKFRISARIQQTRTYSPKSADSRCSGLT
jgi:AraC family transcriptional regulator